MILPQVHIRASYFTCPETDLTERYSFRYGRIETLSGFANGIFLVLISIFIIFEAIQRL